MILYVSMTGKELKRIRERLDWSQQKLADAAGVARNSIARQERGELGIKESLARLIRLIATEAGVEVAHARGGRQHASFKPAKGSKPRYSQSTSRQRPRKDSVS
jgi:transcriptional regulator with XRE-family HTH domain